MMENEAIECLKLEGGIEIKGNPGRIAKVFDALDMAIEALEKVQHYQEMDKKLREAFGDCDGLLETAVDSLCRHEGEDIGSPVKSRLLTDETVDVWDAYRAIGTVEECREAVEKRKLKNPVKDKYHHNCCPNCGWIVSGEGGYGEEFCPHCENCGQAIQWDNLEEWNECSDG